MATEPVIGPLVIRCFIAGELAWKETHEVTDTQQLADLGMEHVKRLVGETRPWLIEIEILADPSPERFIRFGNDRAGMVDPLPFPKKGQ